jgi:hypothetical protein
MRPREMRKVVSIGPVILLVLLLNAFSPSAASAESAPAWRIYPSAEPTNFVPGSSAEAKNPVPQYRYLVKNVGADTSVGASITDELPPGIAAAPGIPPSYSLRITRHSPSKEVERGVCPVSGRRIVCTVTSEIWTGDMVEVNIPVSISAPAQTVVRNELTVEGGASIPATSSIDTRITNEAPIFGADGSTVSGDVFDESGGRPVAGSHPYVTSFSIELPTRYEMGSHGVEPVAGIRNARFELPSGLVVNPNATRERCTMETLSASVLNPARYCPPASQIGEVMVQLGTAGFVYVPLYNLVPPPGTPAALGFNLESTALTILGGVTGGFRLSARSSDLATRFRTTKFSVYLWGVPSDPRHDERREGEGCILNENHLPAEGCAIEASPSPFVTMPTACGESPSFTANIDSWLGSTFTSTRRLGSQADEPFDVSGCGSLAFSPTISSRATTDAGESPSGLEFSLHQPQDESLDGRSTAALKDVRVTLPAGMSLNPSAANGLGSCTEEQMGYAPEGSKISFDTVPQSCPNSAKVGTMDVKTPLLKQELHGAVYVAKPFDNPFGSLLAIYLAIEDEETGIVAKLAGKVEPDPTTGQLTARFTENPQLPLEDIDLHFFKGKRGVLTTPQSCGDKETTSTLVPWSTPEGAAASPSDSFSIGSSCSASEANAPKTTSFSAGTVSPLSGAYSPFVLRLSRPDGSQHITGIETTLPEGLLGKLAGIAYCPESGIAQARSREEPEKGKLEQQNPSCPASSEVGTVQVTAGSGSDPIPVSGHAYLAGPYKGAPLSMVAIVPAVAGPFDLGTVVDRVALNVGEYDARIHAVADPLPTIRDGIPLDARSIELKLDRSGFTLNPTSCEAKQIEGTVTTQAGQKAPLSNRFQVGECGRLGFKPSLKISLKGPTKRTGHPALKAVVTYPTKGEYANIARAQVSLPHSEFLDQGNLNKVCKQAELSAGTCPAKAIYGKVKAWTPLLERPLEGNVYLGVGFGYKLPALVAELNGQIRVLLKGKTDTDKQHGIRNTFEAVPDAPVSRFVLELKGGKKYGLLENSENICSKKQNAGVSFRAQNGRVKTLSVRIANSCGKGKKPKSSRHHHRKSSHGKHHR